MRLLPVLVVATVPLLGFAPEPQAAGLSRGQVGLRIIIEGKGDVGIRLEEFLQAEDGIRDKAT